MKATVDLEKLETIFAQMQRNGVNYGLGSKAPSMKTPLEDIKRIDCSGFVRYLLAQASDQEFIIPDGSQMQRAFFEDYDFHQVKYQNAARYMNPKRLFIAFIRPFTNGCGKVGHVWLLSQYNDGDNGTKASTLESHGGVGVNSRDWNNRTLIREVYSCYEIPVVAK